MRRVLYHSRDPRPLPCISSHLIPVPGAAQGAVTGGDGWMDGAFSPGKRDGERSCQHPGAPGLCFSSRPWQGHRSRRVHREVDEFRGGRCFVDEISAGKFRKTPQGNTETRGERLPPGEAPPCPLFGGARPRCRTRSGFGVWLLLFFQVNTQSTFGREF